MRHKFQILSLPSIDTNLSSSADAAGLQLCVIQAERSYFGEVERGREFLGNSEANLHSNTYSLQSNAHT